MQAAPARYVSVSELYTADEVELLLEEIRELEPTSCRGEDLQDFEIAGSGAGRGAGGRSPAGSTERSWDSHAHYSRAPPPPPRPLAPLYCHLRHCASLQGAASLVIVVCSAGALGCAWGAVGLRAYAVPHGARLRLLQLAALSSLLLHAALLFMHVSRLKDLMPLDWDKLAAWSGAWSSVSLVGGGGGWLAALLLAPDYRWTPAPLRALLLAAAVLALAGGLAASTVTFLLTRACCRRHRASWVAAAAAAAAAAGAAGSSRGSRGSRAGSAGSAPAPRAAYRAVPSTSRDHAL